MSITEEELARALASGATIRKPPKDYSKKKVDKPKAQPPVVQQSDPKPILDSVKAVAATLQTTVSTMATVQESVAKISDTEQLTIAAVSALQEKVAAIQNRKPVPFKFTLNRNSNGFIDTVDAEPLVRED